MPTVMESVCDLVNIGNAQPNRIQCQNWFKNALSFCTNTLSSAQKSSCCLEKLWYRFYTPTNAGYPANIIDFPQNPFLLTNAECTNLMHKVNNDYLIIESERDGAEQKLIVLVLACCLFVCASFVYICIKCCQRSSPPPSSPDRTDQQAFRAIEYFFQNLDSKINLHHNHSDESSENCSNCNRRMSEHNLQDKEANATHPSSSSLQLSSRIPRLIPSKSLEIFPSDSDGNSARSSVFPLSSSRSTKKHRGHSSAIEICGKARRTRLTTPYYNSWHTPHSFKRVRTTKL